MARRAFYQIPESPANNPGEDTGQSHYVEER